MINENSKIKQIRDDIAKKCEKCEKMVTKCLKSQPKSKRDRQQVQKMD